MEKAEPYLLPSSNFSPFLLPSRGDGVPLPNAGPGDMATGEIRGQIDRWTFPDVGSD